MATKTPSIPTPAQNLIGSVEALKQIVEVREGRRGDPLDGFVSYRNLKNCIVNDETIVAYLGLAHDHTIEHITPIESSRVLGRGSAGSGDAEELTLSSDYGLSFTFAASSLKINTPQDLEPTAGPTFATVKLTGLTDGYIPYHVSDAAGLADSPFSVSGSYVGLGIVTPLYFLHVVAGSSTVPLTVQRNSDTASHGAGLLSRRSRGTPSSPAAVQQDDILGSVNFQGYSGAWGGYRNSASISAYIDGEPDTGGDTSDMPGRLEFATTADGAGDLTVRAILKQNGYWGFQTIDPVCNVEIEDNATAASMLLKITQDDANVYGLVIGNDTYSTIDTNGLRLYVDNSGHGYIDAIGTANTNILNIQAEDKIQILDYNGGSPSTKFVLDVQTGRLGIGSAPSAPLHVNSGNSGNPYYASAIFTDTVVLYKASGNSAAIVLYSGSFYTQFYYNSTDTAVYFQTVNGTSADLVFRSFGGKWYLGFDGATGNITLGNGSAGVDYALTFNGETNDGTITWMEDEAAFNFDSSIGIACTPLARLEVEDGATAASMLVKITQDDANVYGLVIGNDAFSTTDTHGLKFQVDDSGNALVTWTAGDFTIGPDADPDALKLDSNEDLYLTAGSLVLPASEYVNFGGAQGSGGYGFYCNSGDMQVKDSGESWYRVSRFTIKEDTGDPSGVEGLLCINTVDNNVKMYADGGWRQLASW
jgi:hypothetical protein